MKPLPFSLFAVALGLLTTLLLPVILVVWLHRWELRTVAAADAVRCDAGDITLAESDDRARRDAYGKWVDEWMQRSNEASPEESEWQARDNALWKRWTG